MAVQRLQTRNVIKSFQYKFNLHKCYFDTGMSLTQLVKYAVLIVGGTSAFTSHNPNFALILVFLYGISCYIMGLIWYKWGFRTAEIEVSNQFNLFVKELRKRKV